MRWLVVRSTMLKVGAERRNESGAWGRKKVSARERQGGISFFSVTLSQNAMSSTSPPSTTTPPAESPPRGASAAEDVEASTPPRRAEDAPASTPPRVGLATPAAASLSPYSQSQQHRFNSPNQYANDLDRPFLGGGGAGGGNSSNNNNNDDLDDFGRPRLPFQIVLLRLLFKSINVLLLITGILMLGASADEVVRFQQTAPAELRSRAPWFLFAVGGAGAAIALTACLGLAGASASSGRRWMLQRRSRRRMMKSRCCSCFRSFCCCCCSPAPPTAFLLGAYAAVLSALLVFQVALALALSADASWRKAHLPEDPTGDEEAVAALIARQLWGARALAAAALALQLANVGIAGALGSAHVSALEAAAETRAPAARRERRSAGEGEAAVEAAPPLPAAGGEEEPRSISPRSRSSRSSSSAFLWWRDPRCCAAFRERRRPRSWPSRARVFCTKKKGRERVFFFFF